MTKCHAVPAKTIKLSYGSGPFEFADYYEFAEHFSVIRAHIPPGGHKALPYGSDRAVSGFCSSSVVIKNYPYPRV